MRTTLKLFCWMTLFADLCVAICSVFHGAFGNGYPVATIRFGEFAVTSAMPGGPEFIMCVAMWTGVLAGAVLYLMRQTPTVRPNRPLQPPSGGSASGERGSMGDAARG